VVEPITTGLIATTCALGMVKGLSGKAAVAAATRVIDTLRRSRTPTARDVLEATHAAFVRSIQLMAEACSVSGGEATDQFSAQALSTLARDPDFTDFRSVDDNFPERDLDQRIRAIFDASERDLGFSAADAVMSAIEPRMAYPLSDTHRSLFREGLGQHPSWPRTFELLFAEQVTEKERLFRSLAFDRLNEVLSFAQRHQSDLSVLHARLGSIQNELLQRFDRLEKIIAEQAGVPLPTMRAIARAFGKLQPEADASELERYLRAKAQEYHRYRERAEAIETRDNISHILLGRAQDAVNGGDFGEADRLIAEAEENDQQISRELRLSADQRDIDRSRKRALRGDYAKLRGDYESAIALYDSAADMVPQTETEVRFALEYAAAEAASEAGERLADALALPEAISRWQALLSQVNASTQTERWVILNNALGHVLMRLGDREENPINTLNSAVNAFRAGLSVCDPEKDLFHWAMSMSNLGNALFTKARVEGDESATESIAVFEETLTRVSDRTLRATVENNLGNSLFFLAQRHYDVDQLQSAVSAFERALGSAERNLDESSWAGFQSNLGMALSLLGTVTHDAAALMRAVEAFHCSLEVRTRERMPLKWADTQSNLGTALDSIAVETGQDAYWRYAFEAYRGALEIYSTPNLRLDWALTSENLARALVNKAGLTADCESGREAVRIFESVLEVFTNSAMTWNRSKAEEGLARAIRIRDLVCVEANQIADS
jgi:hypothetical protein